MQVLRLNPQVSSGLSNPGSIFQRTVSPRRNFNSAGRENPVASGNLRITQTACSYNSMTCRRGVPVVGSVKDCCPEGNMKNFALLAFAALSLPLLAQNTPPPKTPLKVGDPAPDFTVPARSNTSGKDIKLSDFQGKKNVILAFFPAAFTGG